MKLFDKIVKAYDKVSEAYIRFSLLHFFVVGSTGAYLTYDYIGNPIYHLSGSLTAAIASMLDGDSTRPAIRLANTEEAKKIGLDKCAKETNILCKDHPTEKEFEKSHLISHLIRILLGTVFPAVGYAYLSETPFLCRHNLNAAKYLKNIIKERKLDLTNLVK